MEVWPLVALIAKRFRASCTFMSVPAITVVKTRRRSSSGLNFRHQSWPLRLHYNSFAGFAGLGFLILRHHCPLLQAFFLFPNVSLKSLWLYLCSHLSIYIYTSYVTRSKHFFLDRRYMEYIQIAQANSKSMNIRCTHCILDLMNCKTFFTCCFL